MISYTHHKSPVRSCARRTSKSVAVRTQYPGCLSISHSHPLVAEIANTDDEVPFSSSSTTEQQFNWLAETKSPFVFPSDYARCVPAPLVPCHCTWYARKTPYPFFPLVSSAFGTVDRFILSFQRSPLLMPNLKCIISICTTILELSVILQLVPVLFYVS